MRTIEHALSSKLTLAVFILEDALSVWTNLRLSSRTTEDSSSRRIMRLVPVFTLEKNNQTNNECLPKFVQMDNASSSIKTAIEIITYVKQLFNIALHK